MPTKDRIKPKIEYDDLTSRTTQKKAVYKRRPNRKPIYPKTLKVSFDNKKDVDAFARLLRRPLTARSKAFSFTDTEESFPSDSAVDRSTWKLNVEGLKKYTPKKNKKWNTDWFFRSHWKHMVPFEQERVAPFLTFQITFPKEANLVFFARLIKQRMTPKTSSIFFPYKEPTNYKTHWWVSRDKKPNQPRYPIFVVSKGRAHLQKTMKTLSDLKLKYYVVVEPHEEQAYKRIGEVLFNGDATYLVLEKSNHRMGPGYARNACWDYAKEKLNAKRFFVLDDNIDGFYRLHKNRRYRCGDATPFRALEDFVDRYENVPVAGFQYRFFKPSTEKSYPFKINTRIYSAALISTADDQFRQRGRYNEDNIQSIDVLKAGFATIEFQCFVTGKAATQTQEGGNTAEFYAPEGKRNRAKSTLNKSQMLVEIHPDVATREVRYGREHHKVRWERFRDIWLKKTAIWIDKLEQAKTNKKMFREDAYKMRLVPMTKKSGG